METADAKKMRNITKLKHAQKVWRFCAIIWPLLCVFFSGVVLCDSARNVDERIADAFFIIIPLIFFTIGMSVRHRLMKEQAYATAFANAVVVSNELIIRSGKRIFFPEFEFQANETIYRVRHPIGCSYRIVSEGKSVDLYYNPNHPEQFYVPVMQKHDNRVSLLLCGIGVVYPIIGLTAPLIRAALLVLNG